MHACVAKCQGVTKIMKTFRITEHARSSTTRGSIFFCFHIARLVLNAVHPEYHQTRSRVLPNRPIVGPMHNMLSTTTVLLACCRPQCSGRRRCYFYYLRRSIIIYEYVYTSSRLCTCRLLAGGPAFHSLSYADSKRQAARPISYFYYYTYISRLAVAKYNR